MSKPPKDMMLPLGRSENGVVVVGARFTADEEGNRNVSIGEFRPIEEGKPIMGDILKARPIPGTSYVELTTEMEHPNPLPSARKGRTIYSIPSKQFEEGWERIFGAAKANDVPPDTTVH